MADGNVVRTTADNTTKVLGIIGSLLPGPRMNAHPLSIGNVVSVRAVRMHAGGRKNDWNFNFVNGEWRTAQGSLSDDEIRKCLMPEGPPPLY